MQSVTSRDRLTLLLCATVCIRGKAEGGLKIRVTVVTVQRARCCWDHCCRPGPRAQSQRLWTRLREGKVWPETEQKNLCEELIKNWEKPQNRFNIFLLQGAIVWFKMGSMDPTSERERWRRARLDTDKTPSIWENIRFRQMKQNYSFL